MDGWIAEADSVTQARDFKIVLPYTCISDLFILADIFGTISFILFLFLCLRLSNGSQKTPHSFSGHSSKSGQVWVHTPEQRVAASTLRQYPFGVRLAIAKTDARPAMPIFVR